MFDKFKIKFLIAGWSGSTLFAMLVFSVMHASAQEKSKLLELPTRYDAHRFYVEPTAAADGTRLSFFTDTGGGLFLFADTVERLKIETLKIEADGGRKMEVVSLPPFKPENPIPAPLGSPGGKLTVAPVAQRVALAKDWSGMLGQQWFAGRVWTFDYPKQKLFLRADGDVPAVKEKHRVSLGFKTKADEKRA